MRDMGERPWSGAPVNARSAARVRGLARAAGVTVMECERLLADGKVWCYKHGWTTPPPSQRICKQCKRDYENHRRSVPARRLKERQAAAQKTRLSED